MTNPVQQMMSGMMKPNDMPSMLLTMVDNMFREITTAYRIAFM